MALNTIKQTNHNQNGVKHHQTNKPEPKWAIIQHAYHGVNKLHFDDDYVHFVLDQHAELYFYSASSQKNNSSWVDMSLHSNTFDRFWEEQFCSYSLVLHAERKHIPSL
jgi:hypothetical protein